MTATRQALLFNVMLIRKNKRKRWLTHWLITRHYWEALTAFAKIVEFRRNGSINILSSGILIYGYVWGVIMGFSLCSLLCHAKHYILFVDFIFAVKKIIEQIANSLLKIFNQKCCRSNHVCNRLSKKPTCLYA